MLAALSSVFFLAPAALTLPNYRKLEHRRIMLAILKCTFSALYNHCEQFGGSCDFSCTPQPHLKSVYRSLPLSPFFDPSLTPEAVFLPDSPLDAMSILASSKPALQAVESFSLPSKLFTNKRTAAELKSLPPCQRKCTNKLSDILGDVLYSNNYAEKYHQICATYKQAKVCVLKQQIMCHENGESFDVITSGLHYMCIEQGKAFNATIGCIEQSAFTVQGFCEHQCKTRDALLNVITEPAFSQPFGEFLRAVRSKSPDAVFGDTHIGYEPDLYNFPDEFPTGIGLDDLEFLHPDWSKSFSDFEYIVGHVCHQVECGLMCMKGKFDMMCSNNAGMLLSLLCKFLGSKQVRKVGRKAVAVPLRQFNLLRVLNVTTVFTQEAFVRPLALSMQRFPPAFLALGVALPQQCRFLASGTKMIRHRIDPAIHAKLLHQFGTTDEEEYLNLRDEDSYDYEGSWSPIYGDTDIASLVDEYYSSGNFVDGEDNSSDIEGSAEESTRMDLVHESSGDFIVSSDNQHQKYRVVYRTVLSTTPDYYELTANSTGTMRCRIFNKHINAPPQGEY